MCVQLKKASSLPRVVDHLPKTEGRSVLETRPGAPRITRQCGRVVVTDRSSQAVLRVVRRTGLCLSFVLFVAMIGAGKGIRFNCFSEIRVQQSGSEGFRLQTLKCVYRV